MNIDDDNYAECVFCGDPIDIYEDEYGIDRNHHYAHKYCILQEICS